MARNAARLKPPARDLRTTIPSAALSLFLCTSAVFLQNHPTKKPSPCERGLKDSCLEAAACLPALLLCAVTADRFHRAAFHRFLRQGCFGVVFRLFIHVAVAAVVVAGKIGGRGLAAEIA